MRQFTEMASVDLSIESAGTIGHHVGSPADARMRQAAGDRGYEITSMARQVNSRDLDDQTHDLVIAMDSENYRDLARISGRDQPNVRLFSDYLGDEWPRDVPDPYYGGDEGFEYVLDMIEAGCPAILSTLTGTDVMADMMGDEEF